MKRMLLDTHVFLWWLADDPALGKRAKKEIAKGANQVFVSAVSLWEIAIKRALGKLRAPDDLADAVQKELFSDLPVSLHHARQIDRLPLLHRDPFDRMLVAQAQCEGLIVVTADEVLARYGVECLKAGG